MARTKNSPECVKTRCALAQRLRELRTEIFGDRGGPEMARRLNLPIRTWYNYESGVTIPAEVVLSVVELTSVNPSWLLHGKEPKFGNPGQPSSGQPSESTSVSSLLRAALKKLEQATDQAPRAKLEFSSDRSPSIGPADDDATDQLLIGVEDAPHRDPGSAQDPRYLAARRDWLRDERRCRCVRVEGQDMAPIVADGAYVAYRDVDESPSALEGQLVVAWNREDPIVRWFQNCGGYALLRAHNPAAVPSTILIPLDDEGQPAKFRRVLWVSTRHN